MKILKLSNIGKFILSVKRKLFKPDSMVDMTEAVYPFNEDTNRNYIRVHGTLIKTLNNPKGLFERDDLVTVHNPETDRFVSGYVRGCGSKYTKEKNFQKEAITLDYDQRNALGIYNSHRSVDLKMWLSRDFEAEYFLGYQNSDLGSRIMFLMARRERILGTIVGMLFGFITAAVSVSTWFQALIN